MCLCVTVMDVNLLKCVCLERWGCSLHDLTQEVNPTSRPKRNLIHNSTHTYAGEEAVGCPDGLSSIFSSL